MSELKVSYIVNGRKIALSEISNSKRETLVGFAVVKYSGQLISRIGRLICEEHGLAPKLEILADETREKQLNLDYRVEGCCPRFVSEVEALLDEP